MDKNEVFDTRNQRFVSPPVKDFSSLRQPLTPGEKKVFDFFNNFLSPQWEIYIQPHLNGLRPDFVLLNPSVGISIFEVKDWNLSAMRYGVDKREGKPPLLWAESDGKRFSLQPQNPVEKIQVYRNEIFNIYCPRLKKNGGFAAVTAGIIFPFCPERQLFELLGPSLEYRGMNKCPRYSPVSGLESLATGNISKIFPEGKREASHLMSPIQAMDLRNWLIEPDVSASQRTPIMLDKEQLAYVTTRTSSGYRRIRGAAGSGKSLVLAARASELLKQNKKYWW
jgi:hypothetical protein